MLKNLALTAGSSRTKRNGENKVDESRSSSYVFVIMKNLNFIIILYLTMLMAHSLYGHIQENTAQDFLSFIDSLPVAPWKLPVVAVGLYGCMLLLLELQELGRMGMVLKAAALLLFGFCISYLTGFSYTGVILLIFADTMQYIRGSKWRFTLTAVVGAVYLLIDSNVFSVSYKVTPLSVYLEYYKKDAQSVLIGVRNVLDSLNFVVFLVYMVLLIRMQMGEKERILSLNEKLNEANEELRQANCRLEQYARESVEAAETRERNRLAMEIHDTLGHALTGIITGIEACTVLMDAAPEATKVQLKAIAEVARQGVTDVRRSIKALRPDVLEKMDLEKALTQMMDEMRSSTNVEIQYECRTGLRVFNEDEENVIYRVVQESITNAIRHGRADKIRVCLEREYNMLSIRVEDNGRGCSDIQKGFGLHHMEERLSMLQGSLRYFSENGFTVEAQIPIRWGAEEKENDQTVDCG